MKTCPYCGSEVEPYGDKFSCLYCELILDKKDVQQNGKRKDCLPASQPSYKDLYRTTTELMTMNTIELLYLLKFARAERGSIYSQRKLFLQAMKEGASGYEEAEKYTFKEYEFWTRKCFVLENLIRERISYIPQKLTESYIQNFAGRMLNSSKKDMSIKQPKCLK
ncbi:hypothetical protein WQ54_09630 [Bacillus sp. SA1-12]|uniref:hypothetical protein n=1 Tax=Bacillus sp. SA1-12 TaxID=1455638 RepID=UPI000625DB76|nr:hypothetical protein [Bacillus sp. SA1-12]KKI92420.1 hypothetical protein WQ54_09630 [Bacillus sp. SA1-12]